MSEFYCITPPNIEGARGEVVARFCENFAADLHAELHRQPIFDRTTLQSLEPNKRVHLLIMTTVSVDKLVVHFSTGTVADWLVGKELGSGEVHHRVSDAPLTVRSLSPLISVLERSVGLSPIDDPSQ